MSIEYTWAHTVKLGLTVQLDLLYALKAGRKILYKGGVLG